MKIALGICGSIAAYKAAELTRLLVKEGHEVRVMMTDDATQFITPLTLATLSKHPVATSFVNDDQSWNSHVELGLWADALVIAPITANTLSKLAYGVCDNIITAMYLSARCKTFVAPAMDVDMWQHVSTQRNVKQLIDDGVHVLDVDDGELASGLVGLGRMAEPQRIVETLKKFFAEQSSSKKKLSGVNVLVSAGPTRERLDPVRFLSNESSGKMGIAVAEAFANLGADVTLVLGPVTEKIHYPGIKIINVETAAQMHEAMVNRFEASDVTVMCAAVADYMPAQPQPQKIKKQNAALTLELKPTVDILADLGKRKTHQLLVGFALETENETEHALDKLRKKNLDFVVLNSLRDRGAGFGHDTNKITIFSRHSDAHELPLLSKHDAAEKLVARLAAALPVPHRV